MAEQPQTPEEFTSRHRALLVEIIDRAISDPAWKARLLSDPQAAFDEAGLLPEVDALNPVTWEKAEVVGQGITPYLTSTWCVTWRYCLSPPKT